jgi:hypothetical protein
MSGTSIPDIGKYLADQKRRVYSDEQQQDEPSGI